MANVIEYKDEIAFHPGSYIEDLIDDWGLTQAEFAKRLDTTPKNLSILIRGEQSLSVDIALKLERVSGVSATTWLNIQHEYDLKKAKFEDEKNKKDELDILNKIDYRNLENLYKLPKCKKKLDELDEIRKFLQVASLKTLKLENLSIDFHKNNYNFKQKEIINNNIMLQIAVNTTIQTDAKEYDKRKLINLIEKYRGLHLETIDEMYNNFLNCGVVICKLSKMKDASLTSASKKVGKKMMIMVCDEDEDKVYEKILYQAKCIVESKMGITID